MMFITLLSSIIFVALLSTAKTTKDCTPKPTDIVFVLDESGSVGGTNFNLQNEFVAKLVEGFDIGDNNTQVAVITFSSDVVVEFYLNAFNNKAQLLENIKRINYSHPGLTLTHKALNVAQNEVLNVANGMRPDALPFVIVLTDGKSMPSQVTLKEAKLLHDKNITIFAIGISDEVNEDELRGIASDPKDVIIVKDFGSLMSIQKQALNGACEAIKKRANGNKSVKVTTDTILTTSMGSSTTVTTTTGAPTISSITKHTTTSFEEKYSSFNLSDYSSISLSNIATTTRKPLTNSSKTTSQTTLGATTTDPPVHQAVVSNAYSSTDNGHWIESSSLPPKIVSHSRKTSAQQIRTSSQTAIQRTTNADPPTMHSVVLPTYSSTDNLYWTDSSSTYSGNFAKFGQSTKFSLEKSTQTSTRITNAFNAVLSKTIATRTSNINLLKKNLTTDPTPSTATTKHSNKNTIKFTSKLISNIRTTTSSGERASVTNSYSKRYHPHSRFIIPGYFQFIEVGLLAITAIVCMGLLGCCCLKCFGGKRSQDNDDDEEEDKNTKRITTAWKDNHRSPISKPNRWNDDF